MTTKLNPKLLFIVFLLNGYTCLFSQNKLQHQDKVETTIAQSLIVNSEAEPEYQLAYNGNENNIEIYDGLSPRFPLTDSNSQKSGYSVNSIKDNSPSTSPLIVTSYPITICPYTVGMITIDVSGGLPPYHFSWSTNDTTQSITVFHAGTYTVTVTDNSNQSVFSSIEVLSFPVNTISYKSTNVTCKNGKDGAIDLTVSGHTPVIFQEWHKDYLRIDATTEDISGLSSGFYTVYVFDVNGCASFTSITIDEPQTSITTNAVISDVKCKGDSDGKINLEVAGGVAPYSFKWSDGSTSNELNNKTADTYNVEITDANGCRLNKSYKVTEPSSSLNVQALNTAASCVGASSGIITLTTTGGTEPYSYNWSNGTTNKDLTNVTTGPYDVVVTDANGCSVQGHSEVSEHTKADLSGIASFSKGTIEADDADVVLLDASSIPYSEISTVRMQANGYFKFTDITPGLYVVYVRIDDLARLKYPGVFNSYFSFNNTTCMWDKADKILLGCGDQPQINLKVFENPDATSIGSGKVSGIVMYDNGLLKSAQNSVADVVVLLIDNSTGLPVKTVRTDAQGYYEINNIKNGNYSIYIDIPGLVQNSTHQLNFTDLAMEYAQIDYKIDALVHMEINKVVAINTLNNQSKGNFKVDLYPTPATTYLNLRSDAFIGSIINISLFSLTGSMIKDFKKDEYEHSNDLVRIELPSLSNGFFIIKTEVNGSVQFYKFIVQQ